MKLIPLTQGQFAKVDDDDFEKFSHVRWYACWAPSSKSFYAQRNVWSRETKKAKILLMHRAIANPPKGYVVDHENHDTLDNQKINLRTCTRSNNAANRKGADSDCLSGIRGVTTDRRRGGYFSRIEVDQKSIYLGHFDDKESAAAAYAVANEKYFGAFGGGL